MLRKLVAVAPQTVQHSARFSSATTSTMAKSFKTALIQMTVGTDRDANLTNADKLINTATAAGANLVILPECFNSPYGTSFFVEYGEEFGKGPTCKMLADAAKRNNIYLVGGTFPESDGGKFYNTCTAWGRDGRLLAKYRKMHLFDIDIKGGITFQESKTLSPGSQTATFVMDGTRIGLGICYDMRFEELAKLYRKEDCSVLVYPGAFNMTTGPLHWELLQRGRALDNQMYVFAVSPARGTKGYIAWAHSQATDPWGKVVAKAGHEQEIVYCNVELDEVAKVREQIPIFKQRRVDLYDTVYKGSQATTN